MVRGMNMNKTVNTETVRKQRLNAALKEIADRPKILELRKKALEKNSESGKRQGGKETSNFS